MVAVDTYFRPNNFIDPNKNTKMRGNDRVFVLEPIDGTHPVDVRGMIDKRLFSGENRMHAVRDEGSFNLWYFKYDAGALPQALSGQRFTKFDEATKYLERYFSRRNIKIKEVVD